MSSKTNKKIYIINGKTAKKQDKYNKILRLVQFSCDSGAATVRKVFHKEYFRHMSQTFIFPFFFSLHAQRTAVLMRSPSSPKKATVFESPRKNFKPPSPSAQVPRRPQKELPLRIAPCRIKKKISCSVDKARAKSFLVRQRRQAHQLSEI